MNRTVLSLTRAGYNSSKRTEYFRRQNLHLAPPFLVYDYISSANLLTPQNLKAKLLDAERELSRCRACPRNCDVNRLEDKRGLCNTGRKAIVSTAFPHFGEETVLQGWSGSGTIFFGMCNMRCVFCQNWDISQQKHGREMTANEIADMMMLLQNEYKCHNINFVTPEHVAPQVAESIVRALDLGLKVPIVYNTSSYDGLSSLKLMDGLVDIYLADFKFWTNETSQRLAKCKNYPEVAKEAIKEMHRQVGDLVFSESGLAQKGLILRHLVMPGLEKEAESILQWVREEVSADTYGNIMEQYHPDFKVGKTEFRSRIGNTDYSDIDRPVTHSEVDSLRDYARSIGLWRFEHDNFPAF